MKKALIFTLALMVMATSFYVLGSNEEAAVAAFGKNEPKGEVIVFDKDDFVIRSQNGNTLDAIQITGIPSQGRLTMGDKTIVTGDIVDLDNISQMTFRADGIEQDVYDRMYFKPVFSKTGISSDDVMVTLTLSNKPNNTPVAVNAEYKTYTNIKLCGTLKAIDTDNDECTFEIVSKPKKGDLTLDGAEFVYTPKQNKSGKDSFEFKVTDSRGNISASAKITVQICKTASKESFSYNDMENSPAHYAALYLREEGIMVGETFGEESFFYPDETVSRAQFVALISSVTQLSVPTVSVGTGLSDNEAIPSWARPYVAAAINCGVISGENGSDGNKVFRANDPITRAEAAAIIDRAMALATDGREMTFGDTEEVPAWAEQSIVNTTAAGILSVFDDNTVRAYEKVTREDAALMLQKAICYAQEKTKDTGFLERLFD